VQAHVVDCDALLAEHDENEVREGFKVSEKIAIAEALYQRMQGRVGRPNNSGKMPVIKTVGESRDLAAKKAGLGSGRTFVHGRSGLTPVLTREFRTRKKPPG
jgi:hypothetical protein